MPLKQKYFIFENSTNFQVLYFISSCKITRVSRILVSDEISDSYFFVNRGAHDKIPKIATAKRPFSAIFCNFAPSTSILIVRRSRLLGWIALNLSFRSTQKRAPYDKYRRQWIVTPSMRCHIVSTVQTQPPSGRAVVECSTLISSY